MLALQRRAVGAVASTSTMTSLLVRRRGGACAAATSRARAAQCGAPACAALARRPVAAFAAAAAARALATPAPRRHFAVRVVQVPPMGDSITDGELGVWNADVGDSVAADDVVCEIETDKINVEIRAPAAGTIVERMANEGDRVLVGADLYKLDEDGGGGGGDKAKKQDDAAKPKQDDAAKPKQSEAEKPAAKAAASKPAEPASPPTPPAAPKQQASGGGGGGAPTPAAASSDAITGTRSETRVKMKRVRNRIAQRLKDSQNTYALLTTFNEIDMSALMAMRTELKDAFAKRHGVKLGFMSAFVKASTLALQRQPVVNAVIDDGDIVYRDYVDVSVAVASPNGLVVPVLRNCEAQSFADVEANLAALAAKARDQTLSLEEMTGGTFTISNGGVFGSLMGTPIVNPPQSAILGMHAIKDRAVAVDGQVVVRPMMYVALTYDHRLIDGREAATFLVDVKNVIEDPRRFVLDV